MSSTHPDPVFAGEVSELLAEIKKLPGGRKKFIEIFSEHKAESMTRHWIKGTVVAKESDKTMFYETIVAVKEAIQQDILADGIRRKEALEKLNAL